MVAGQEKVFPGEGRVAVTLEVLTGYIPGGFLTPPQAPELRSFGASEGALASCVLHHYPLPL